MTKFKFSVGPWNVHSGADSYGPATRDEIAFEEKIRTFAELGFSAIQFHDDDAVPNINDYTEEEIKEKARTLKKMLDKKVKDSKVFYYMDTLTYLRKGGRIGLVTSVVGSILNIKPIISCNEDGVYYTAAKIRGAKQALSRLLSEASSFAGGRPCLTALLNGQGQGAADELKPRLIAGIPEGRLIMEKAITASLAVHTGPGLVGIGVLRL